LRTAERARPAVVVMGATADEPPPGIEAIASDVELRYAPDRASLERGIVDAEVVYTWWGEREDLVAAWPLARNLRWVAASNVGVNALLFPALVESDVVLTNARGAADQPITETVVGFVVALAKGFRPMFDRQRARELKNEEQLQLEFTTSPSFYTKKSEPAKTQSTDPGSTTQDGAPPGDGGDKSTKSGPPLRAVSFPAR